MTKLEKKERFLYLRNQLGMSQTEMAVHLKRSASCVIKWENDINEIPRLVIDYLEQCVANESNNPKV